MKFTACVVAAVLLSACGGGTGWKDNIVVRRYEDVNGHPTPYPNNLGFTYNAGDSSGAEHGKAGYNCLINEMLLLDADPDKIVRVIMHELENVLILDDGEYPPYEYGWYAYDSDTLPPEWPVPEDEGAWIATHGDYDVAVGNDWLDEPTDMAIQRLNDAAGKVIYHR